MITFLTRTNPSILQPPADGAGLFICSILLLDLSSRARVLFSNAIGETRDSTNYNKKKPQVTTSTNSFQTVNEKETNAMRSVKRKQGTQEGWPN